MRGATAADCNAATLCSALPPAGRFMKHEVDINYVNINRLLPQNKVTRSKTWRCPNVVKPNY